MKKAATKSSGPLSLGNKRACKKCQTKFYDFNKDEINCPKCGHKMSQQDFLMGIPTKSETRKKSSEKVMTEGLMQSDEADSSPAEPFESDEDLSEDTEEVVEDIAVQDEGEENDF
ncbi:MAG: TIGR02300 family protein [Deltaproteobacteria bacterium]